MVAFSEPISSFFTSIQLYFSPPPGNLRARRSVSLLLCSPLEAISAIFPFPVAESLAGRCYFFSPMSGFIFFSFCTYSSPVPPDSSPSFTSPSRRTGFFSAPFSCSRSPHFMSFQERLLSFNPLRYFTPTLPRHRADVSALDRERGLPTVLPWCISFPSFCFIVLYCRGRPPLQRLSRFPDSHLLFFIPFGAFFVNHVRMSLLYSSWCPP